MAQIKPSTSQLQSTCNVDIETSYYDINGKRISDSSIETVKLLGFDVDSKFTKTRELIVTLKVGSYNPAIVKIEDIQLLKDAFNALKGTTPEIQKDLAKRVMGLSQYSNEGICQGWFTVTKKPTDDVEVTFPNGETAIIPVKNLKLKVFSDLVPNEYYTTTCAIRTVGQHEVVYFPANDFVKIGCNKVKLEVIISYLEEIERDYAFLLQCLELPEPVAKA